MALSHKNAVNEYLVETAGLWPFSSNALKTKIEQLNVHIYFLESKLLRYTHFGNDILESKKNAVNNLLNETDDHVATIENFKTQISADNVDEYDKQIVDAFKKALARKARSVPPP